MANDYAKMFNAKSLLPESDLVKIDNLGICNLIYILKLVIILGWNSIFMVNIINGQIMLLKLREKMLWMFKTKLLNVN